MIAHSHYENIDLAMMCQGFAPGYFDAELEQIEHEVVPLAQDLAANIEDEVIPPKALVSWLDESGNDARKLVIMEQILVLFWSNKLLAPF
jgi:hypothetical protein